MLPSANRLNIDDYKYTLPDDRIAKFPLEERDKSKLLVYRNVQITTDVFENLSCYMDRKDTMTFNNSRVIRARLEMKKDTGARIEIFCLEPFKPADYQQSFAQSQTCQWKCIVGNFRKWDAETILKKQVMCDGFPVELQARWAGTSEKYHIVRFEWDIGVNFGTLLDACGNVPIPPYLKRKPEEIDDTRYQTIYSLHKGSVAAPTAGLHFTPQLLQRLAEKRVKQCEITLHVGAGTFKPVKHSNAAEHDMHTEHFSITVKMLRNLLANKGVMTAVGTTSLRALESVYWLGVKLLQKKPKTEQLHLDQWECYELPQDVSIEQSFNKLFETLEARKINALGASTKIMIVPGYKFKICRRLITNFHQPQSSLLLLVAAFVGDRWRDIYQYALEHDFRFLSYGDSSLLELLPDGDT